MVRYVEQGNGLGRCHSSPILLSSCMESLILNTLIFHATTKSKMSDRGK